MLPNNKSSFYALLRGLRTISAAGYTPEDIVCTVLNRWMSLVTPSLDCPAFEQLLANEDAILKFADWLTSIDLLTGGFWLSSAYAALLGTRNRKANAMYFTPPYLAKRLLDNAKTSLLKGKVIDPACGGAAFLAPAAIRISKLLHQNGLSSNEILSYIEANLYGVDTEPFLCKLSTAFLRMVLAEHIKIAGREPQLNIHTGDGLYAFEELIGEFQLVLCNPPYRKLNKPEIAPYLKRYKHIIVGQPNLYALFIRRAMCFLRNSGSAVLLTPMSFLSGRSFSKLRAALAQEGDVSQLDLIHNKVGVFLEAEQDTVISVWHKSNSLGRLANVYCLSLEGTPIWTGRLHIDKSDSPWPIPREVKDSELIPLFSETHHTLESYGYAARTGAIVVHRDPRARYRTLGAANKAQHLVPLIWQGDIGSDGILRLEESQKKNIDRYIDVGSAQSPAVVKGPALAMQRVTSASQKRRLICAVVPKAVLSTFGGVAGENHVCLIEKVSPNSDIEPEFLCAILQTQTVDRLFRCMSGATNVSSYELYRMPLPDPAEVRIGLTLGLDFENAVRSAYGLDELSQRGSKKPQRIVVDEGGHGFGRGGVCFAQQHPALNIIRR